MILYLGLSPHPGCNPLVTNESVLFEMSQPTSYKWFSLWLFAPYFSGPHKSIKNLRDHHKRVVIAREFLPQKRPKECRFRKLYLDVPLEVNGSMVIGSVGYNLFTNHLLTSWDIQVHCILSRSHGLWFLFGQGLKRLNRN